MKKFFKRVPALVIVSLIIVLTVVSAFAVANSAALGDWLNHLVTGDGKLPEGMVDVNNNGKFDILDVLNAYVNPVDANDKGWTQVY
jgi:hypothetical protein